MIPSTRTLKGICKEPLMKCVIKKRKGEISFPQLHLFLTSLLYKNHPTPATIPATTPTPTPATIPATTPTFVPTPHTPKTLDAPTWVLLEQGEFSSVCDGVRLQTIEVNATCEAASIKPNLVKSGCTYSIGQRCDETPP